MNINDLRDNDGARKKRMRVGRGEGSGKGKTAGRGHKGQKARSGVAIKGFEGGQMPLHMRIPKRGFNNPFGTDYAELNLGMLQRAIDNKVLKAGKLGEEDFRKANLVRGGKDGVSLLGKGDLSAKVELTVARASKGAVVAVEEAGGSVTQTVGPKVREEKTRG